ncbi:cell division protein FtsX [Lutispora thermophila]|uniref:Cell division protein FtsX n=1 Tax=Lutispora thermophila DSM 19022 TaxID=1122184 RepID=A0A1M6D8J7_9FIRM|nr:permease-like cell division protein FtsX [Lutispora thermophila]SHI69328.1 cell division protein FtsX [Lutispora thermophila DSM 19022]
MKTIMNNFGYFMKEARTIIKINFMSNILSIVSIGLILFFAAATLSSWWISNQVVEIIEDEAEINVYFAEDIDKKKVEHIINNIETLAGVEEVRLVDENEAYHRMEEILGKEAKVLQYLDDNPFSPYIEVQIDLKSMESVIEGLKNIEGIDQIRDNKEIFDKVRNLSSVLKTLGYIFIVAVGASTLIIISHIIRTGIYENREQINTLILLGAPDGFISFPFIIEGMILTLGGGLLASIILSLTLRYAYSVMTGPLPFIPLPDQKSMVTNLVSMIMLLSAVLGLLGSLFGLRSAKSR